MKDTTSFWTWFKLELVPGVYDAHLYDGFGDRADDKEDGLIRNKIGFVVGLPRIRQIRFKPGRNVD